MNLDYLLTYLEVIEAGSFSEVAKRMQISQPAVSFQIQKLERDLGVRLIDRSHQPLTMTEAGRRLLRFARVVKQEREGLFRDLERLRDEVTGEIVVAASTIPGEVLVPPIVAGFRQAFPGAGFRMEVMDSGAVIQQVSGGTYDVGFCGVEPEEKGLERFAFAEDDLVLIAFPEHPFASRDSVSLMDLAGETLILRKETSGTQQHISSLLSRKGIRLEGKSPSVVVGSPQSVVAAVEARLGIAFVSGLSARKSISLGMVRQVPVSDFELRRRFYCIYHRDRVVSRLLSEFLDFLKARVPEALR